MYSYVILIQKKLEIINSREVYSLKKILLFSLTLFLILVPFWVAKSNESSNDLTTKDNVIYADQELRNNQVFNVKSFKVLPDKEITLIEAYKIGFNEVKKYDKEPQLLFLNSVDDERADGENGKRRNWQGVFALPNRNHDMVFVIEKGKLKKYTIIAASTEYRIKDSDIQLDSDQALKKAIKQFKLKINPKEDVFRHGYHFRLLRDAKNIFLSVRGRSNGNYLEIYYDARNGKYLGRTESPIVEDVTIQEHSK